MDFHMAHYMGGSGQGTRNEMEVPYSEWKFLYYFP